MRQIVRLSVVSVFLFSLVGCDKQETSTPQAPPAPPVDVSKPITRVITEWDEYTGRFGAVEEVEVRARVSGYLDKVNFKDGQLVNKGDVLFIIDQRPFEIALQAADSRFELAEKELERGRDLRKKNSISQEELDNRVSRFELAQAELDRAKLDLEFTQIKAPISGLASRDLVNVGNLVNGTASNATLLTTIVSVDPIHFYFDAGQREYLRYVRLNQSKQRESSRTSPTPVAVKLQDENDYVHEGVMDFVDNRVDTSTGTIQGRAILDNAEGYLLPGLFGRLRVQARTDVEATLIPDDVIGTNQSLKYVMVLDGDNRVNPKPITLGKLYNKNLRIVQGLSPNDVIVVNGLLRARPGMIVTPNEVDIAAQYPHNE
ncbi:efflux RND transporter periplasmic adaptor subunit [Agaribacter flavus]|uniref:Efflux RND transporter periplasmic adaptor subunit n=1 Tax=Agaribacter flavus TaxID=1902781 RepID=A0ABV7FW82_9ALTE